MDRPPEPLDQLWLWKAEVDGVIAGFTWRGPSDINDFLAAGADRGAEAWERLVRSLNVRAIAQGEQVHGGQVAVLLEGPLRERLTVPGIDGLVTTVAEVALVVRVADCVPVLLWVPYRAVAAVHAGWRSLASGILAAAIRELRRLNFSPAEVRAAVGPAIGPCCYQIGGEVAERLSSLPGGAASIAQREGRLYADLPSLAIAGLAALGVPPGSITHVGPCTSCNRDIFFSYRREGEKAGRQVGAIVLRFRVPSPERTRAC
ncbi:MAG: polyphenol oxidase family protein [Armatimonadetes bacterium]|nr:polyphenol oxidase family protein [Armatimonadota bacterium]